MRTIIRIASRNSRKTIVRRKNIMALKDTIRFESCLKLASEAKKLRDKAQALLKQAQPIEEKAIESFRQVREERLKALQQEKEQLEEELKALRTEYFELASIFCKQKGRHTYTYRSVRTSNTPLYHSFSRGNVYPTETYSTCLVCGVTTDPELFFKPRGYYHYQSEDVIQKASEQTENLNLKKTAQRILEIPEQFKDLANKLNENSNGFEEICSLFGHDAEIINYDCETFKCKCCGKKMGYKKYIDAHYAAKYKGGIVPFYYSDDNPIL